MGVRESFAEYLSQLDEASLSAVLQSRPDTRARPVPRGFAQLAQRLDGAASLSAALYTLNRDAIVVGQAIAALGASATVPEVARLLGASEHVVEGCVSELCERGLAWVDSGTLYLPEQLTAHWVAQIGGGRSVTKIARSVLVDELHAVAEALGVAASGLRKPELIDRLSEAMSDVRSLAAVVAGLPKPARDRLEELRHGYVDFYDGFYPAYRTPRPRGRSDPTNLLIEAGLLLRVNGRTELPREVAVAAWLSERELAVTGRPDIPPAADIDEAAVRPAAQAAAQELLRGVTTLLDDARSKPIAALKKGGVGARERSALAKRLSVSSDIGVFWIDVAYAAGLLGEVDAGYAPTDAYDQWRSAEPGRRWAMLAGAWFALDHAPLSREIDDDKELPPPLPLASEAGAMRRALLRAARPGVAVRAAGDQIDWFFPLHSYDAVQRGNKVAAAVREGELLGVIVADRVTELGEHLLAVVDMIAGASPHDAVAELARRCSALLPEAPCQVIAQSDLTAVVSGQPSVAVSRLLAASAISETRGTAGVWRFTADSVRGALDAGWAAQELLTQLKAVSERGVPQTLEYLISDVARRHGHVRVRGSRSCVVADEATITEILHTRLLAKLGLSQLAPTVLSSACEPDEVLSRLRAVGLSPVAEDSSGTVIVQQRQEHRAATTDSTMVSAPRATLTAIDLARQLIADPNGEIARGSAGSVTLALLAQLNPRLDDAELELLSDAVDRRSDVLIAYRDNNGSRTIRPIQPQQLYGKWLDSWCHLRGGQRDFTVANIESVATVG